VGRSKKLRNKVLKPDKKCIYCGGSKIATEIEHMPPKGMFVGSHRPDGLVFASCSDCNRGSSKLDDAAAFFAAMWGYHEPDKRQQDHINAKFRSMVNNNPNLYKELRPTNLRLADGSDAVDQNGQPYGAMKVDGPFARDAIFRFGAKVAMALHFEETKQIAGPEYQIGVLCFTNANAFRDEVPQQIFEILPGQDMLKQGRWTSKGVFEYKSGKTEDGGSSVHWAVLGQTLCYILFVGPDLPVPQESDGGGEMFRPGCLKRDYPPLRMGR